MKRPNAQHSPAPQILAHLRSYTQPTYQRYIVRIVFMVPFYAVSSFFSLVFQKQALYFATVRDCYEAWVIYNFLALCLAYVGGPGRVEVAMAGYALSPSLRQCTCCLPPMPVNGRFVRACKRGALQFVLVKPILAAATIAAAARGGYEEGDWSPGRGFLWVTLLYNLTYTGALYALLLFYRGTADLLAPFNPVLKFVLVKAVVFATFWQGLAISIAVAAGGLASPRAGQNLQNFIICLEMLPASLGMLVAFPAAEFGPPGGSGDSGGGLRATVAAAWVAVTGRGRGAASPADPTLPPPSSSHARAGGGGAIGLQSMRHAFSIRDVVADTLHQFAPAYQDYVLYAGDGGGGAAGAAEAGASPTAPGSGGKGGGAPAAGTPRTVVRTTTFLAVGAETAARIGRPGGAPVSPPAPDAPMAGLLSRGGENGGAPSSAPLPRSDAPAWSAGTADPDTVPSVLEADDDEAVFTTRAAGGLDALDLIAAGGGGRASAAAPAGPAASSSSVPSVAVEPGSAATRLAPPPGVRTGPAPGALVREASEDLVAAGTPGGGGSGSGTRGSGEGGGGAAWKDVAL